MRILYVTTISGTLNAFLKPHIEALINAGHTVDLASQITRPLDRAFTAWGCSHYLIPFSRFPFRTTNIAAFKRLKAILTETQYDIVHTHTPVASAITRLVCMSMPTVKVFYTAHGFHFYKGANWKNWVMYYPMEKWLSRYTDLLITINREDYDRVEKGFKPKRIELVPGVGIDLARIQEVSVDKSIKRKDIGVPENSIVLLSVGELNHNKNHQVIINALSQLNNPHLHYVVCGTGPQEERLTSLAKELHVNQFVHILGFRNDVIEICKSSDVFVFPSLREGLPVSIMESMACGLPVICSNIRGNNDLIVDGINGKLVSDNSSVKYAEAIAELIANKALLARIAENNKMKVKKLDTKIILQKLIDIYSSYS